MGREAVHDFWSYFLHCWRSKHNFGPSTIQLVLLSLTRSFTGCLAWGSVRGMAKHRWGPRSHLEAEPMCPQELVKQI